MLKKIFIEVLSVFMFSTIIGLIAPIGFVFADFILSLLRII